MALFNNILTCFIDNRTLGPLHSFTSRARGIRPGGLSSVGVDGSILPRFGRFDRSFGGVVRQLGRKFATRQRFAKGTTRRLHAPLTLVRTRVRLFSIRRASVGPRATRFLELLRRRARHVSRVAGALLRVDRLHGVGYDSGVRLTPVASRIFTSLTPVTSRGGMSLAHSNSTLVVNDSALVCHVVFGLARGTIHCAQHSSMVGVSVIYGRGSIRVHMESGNRKVPRRCERDVFRPFFHISGTHDERRNKINLKLTLM